MQDHESVKIQVEPLVEQLPLSIRRGFIRKVYAILSMQLLLTSAMTMSFTFYDPMNAWAVANPSFPMAMSLVSLFLICPLSCYHQKYPINLVLLVAFTFAQSCAVGSICALYTAAGMGVSVLSATCITATVFLGLSLFTHHSKRDFGFLEEWLGSGLLILLAMIIVGMMFSIPYLQLCIASLGCVIFSGYIIYDTHQIVHTLGPDDAIMGAIQLIWMY